MEFYINVETDPDRMLVGLWCDDCQLPSAIRTPLRLFSMDGVTDAGSLTICVDCWEDMGLEGDEGVDGGVLVRG